MHSVVKVLYQWPLYCKLTSQVCQRVTHYAWIVFYFVLDRRIFWIIKCVKLQGFSVCIVLFITLNCHQVKHCFKTFVVIRCRLTSCSVAVAVNSCCGILNLIFFCTKHTRTPQSFPSVGSTLTSILGAGVTGPGQHSIVYILLILLHLILTHLKLNFL